VTADIDFLAIEIKNEAKNIEETFEEIFSIYVDDALRYDIDSLKVKTINEFNKYNGFNVSVLAYLDNTKIKVTIDIGFGDVIYPRCKLMKFPTLLDMEAPKLKTYPIETVIAEKFEAIVSLGYANSRYKDYYDIYVMLKRYEFNGNELTEAIKKTFSNRKTKLSDIVIFEDGFCNDKLRVQRWNSFIKKKKAMEIESLQNVIEDIKDFLLPLVVSINNNQLFEKNWNNVMKEWI
jgi:hypothetical protein